MKKFEIEICRTSYAFKTFNVKAETEEEAIKKAEQMAYNSSDFSEKDADYTINTIYRDENGEKENGEK